MHLIVQRTAADGARSARQQVENGVERMFHQVFHQVDNRRQQSAERCIGCAVCLIVFFCLRVASSKLLRRNNTLQPKALKDRDNPLICAIDVVSLSVRLVLHGKHHRDQAAQRTEQGDQRIAEALLIAILESPVAIGKGDCVIGVVGIILSGKRGNFFTCAGKLLFRNHCNKAGGAHFRRRARTNNRNSLHQRAEHAEELEQQAHILVAEEGIFRNALQRAIGVVGKRRLKQRG